MKSGGMRGRLNMIPPVCGVLSAPHEKHAAEVGILSKGNCPKFQAQSSGLQELSSISCQLLRGSCTSAPPYPGMQCVRLAT